MIDKLKKIFPSLHHYETIPKKINDKLTWFMTNDSQLIGIHPDELEEKDLILFHAFLKPYKSLFPKMSEEEKKWTNWLKENTVHPTIDFSYRLVYFQFPQRQIEPQAFSEAINQLYEKQIPILWESENEGIIIDIIEGKEEENISYKQIIDIIRSDLYINIRFFVGPYYTELKEIKRHYQQLIHTARVAFTYSENKVVTYIEAIPILLMEQTDPTFKTEVRDIMLQDFSNDGDFIKMMEVFFESNLNISVAAKKLYMHRNSLQYRIEKFTEKTGIDIREFHQAIPVYLAILTNEK